MTDPSVRCASNGAVPRAGGPASGKRVRHAAAQSPGSLIGTGTAAGSGPARRHRTLMSQPSRPGPPDTKKAGADMAGMDPTLSMIEAAEASAADDPLRFSTGTAERPPYPDGSFDRLVRPVRRHLQAATATTRSPNAVRWPSRPLPSARSSSSPPTPD